ncbi:major facilitator superfamily domain-containing protein [Lactarius sanguifluus]|nr:major facilitator superfamily domain-containing protein [Lactarius sanguifluus]
MAPLHSESIELPKSGRALSESFGGAQLPSPDSPMPGAVAVRETTDSTGSGHLRFPRGRYGWVVVLACSVISCHSSGQLQLHSSLWRPLINVRLIRWFGTRKACVLGCFFLGLGPLLNGFATKSYGGLFVTNGLILGFGTSLTFMYFKRRRGVANGLVFAGNDRVGIAWAFRILGLSTWVVAIPAALLLKERTRRSAVTVEWGLFRDPKFVLLFLGSGITTFPLLVPTRSAPSSFRSTPNSVGASASLASGPLATFNLASAVGRVGFGVLGDTVGPITALVLALTVNALSMLTIWPASSSIAPLVAFIVINGFGSGGFFSLIPSVVGSVYGNTRTANALAMTVSGWAFGYFPVGPFLPF